MFGAQPAAAGAPDPAGVRAELSEILGQAHAAPELLPWEEREASHYRAALDAMANALSEQEAAQLRLEFATERARRDAP
jgi:hypothetical protein